MARDGIHDVDLTVGHLIRQRRKEIGMSQEVLAQAINLTFQQVQKYERGSNRVSASKLHHIAQTLKVPIHYFFQAMETGEDKEISPTEAGVSSFLTTAEGLELASLFAKLTPARRRGVLALVKSILAE